MKNKKKLTKEEQWLEDLLLLLEQDIDEEGDQKEGSADPDSSLRSPEDEYPNGLEDW